MFLLVTPLLFLGFLNENTANNLEIVLSTGTRVTSSVKIKKYDQQIKNRIM